MKNDGGPAFPMEGGCIKNVHDLGSRWWVEQRGMTLRDYFAAAAIKSGMCPYNAYDPESCALWSYQQADAMLKTRSIGEATPQESEK